MIDIQEMERRANKIVTKLDFAPILLTAEEASKYTGLSVHTLRSRKEQFVYAQPSGKYGQIFFSKSGLEDFIEKRLNKPKNKNKKEEIINE